MTSNAGIGHFRELSDGDSDSLRELIELYLTKTAEQLAALQAALQTSSHTEVSRLAHGLAGANMMVGMDSLVAPLKQLEKCGEEQNLASAPALLEQVDEEFKKIRNTLEAALQNL